MAITIQDDMYEAAMLLPEVEQDACLAAFVRYAFEGIMPDDPHLRVIVAIAAGRLNMSKKRHQGAKEAANARWNAKNKESERAHDAEAMRNNQDACDSHDAEVMRNEYNAYSSHNAENENENENEGKEKESIKEKEKSAKTELTENAPKGFSLHKPCNEPQKDAKKPPNSKQKSTRFKKPTIEEVSRYIQEKGCSVDAEKFWNYYESKGWVVGKSPMKSWTAAIATWEKNNFGSTQKKSPSEKEREAAYAAFAEYDNYAKAHEVRMVQ